MPQFMCLACETRLYSAKGEDDGVGDLCPSCGSLLEPVHEFAEVDGFRSIRSRNRSVEGRSPALSDQIAAQDDSRAHREATLAQARLDIGRWLDDGGGPRPDRGASASNRASMMTGTIGRP